MTIPELERMGDKQLVVYAKEINWNPDEETDDDVCQYIFIRFYKSISLRSEWSDFWSTKYRMYKNTENKIHLAVDFSVESFFNL